MPSTFKTTVWILIGLLFALLAGCSKSEPAKPAEPAPIGTGPEVQAAPRPQAQPVEAAQNRQPGIPIKPGTVLTINKRTKLPKNIVFPESKPLTKDELCKLEPASCPKKK